MSIPKFRAWDRVNNSMISFEKIVGIDFENECIGYKENKGDKTITFFPKFKDIKFMQSSGLKDDLLNDIFVDDIVCVDGEIAKVIFEDGVMMVEDEYGSRENLCDCSPIEVFGNIYENPEFLEGV